MFISVTPCTCQLYHNKHYCIVNAWRLLTNSYISGSTSPHSSPSAVAAQRKMAENPHFWKHFLVVSVLTRSQAAVTHKSSQATYQNYL